MSLSWARRPPGPACPRESIRGVGAAEPVRGRGAGSRKPAGAQPVPRRAGPVRRDRLEHFPGPTPRCPTARSAGKTPSISPGQRVHGGRGDRPDRRRDLFAGRPIPAISWVTPRPRSRRPLCPSAAPAPRSVVATAPAREAPAAPAADGECFAGQWRGDRSSGPGGPRRRCSAGGDAAAAAGRRPAPLARRSPLLRLSGPAAGFPRETRSSANDSVRRFNTLLADFNSRCKSFRYEGDALQSANKQADARQDQLKADADSIVTSWTGQSATALIDLQARQGAAQVQARLKALGYYQGKVDGAWGPRSAAALSNFRQSTGLGDGALWDLATQSALLGK